MKQPAWTTREDAAPRRISGAVALVTGGAHGIGRAIAGRLAAEGAAVGLLDVDESAAQEVAAECVAAGGTMLAVRCDVRDRTSVRSAIRAVAEEHGAPTILINNAGGGHPGPLRSLTDAEWNDTLAMSLTSCFVVSQEVAEPMRTGGGGSIVNVASTAAHVGNVGQAAYAAAKAGMLGLTRVMAVELAPDGIRVNAVSLGAIQTRRTALLPAEGRVQRERRVALRRFGTTDEVAGAVAFLVSPDAGYVTGATLVIDGGLIVTGIDEENTDR